MREYPGPPFGPEVIPNPLEGLGIWDVATFEDNAVFTPSLVILLRSMEGGGTPGFGTSPTQVLCA